MNAVPAAFVHVKANRLKPLAITSAQRHPPLPGTPTFVESGVQDFVSFQWYGMLGPAGTPADFLKLLVSEDRRWRDVRKQVNVRLD